MDIENMKAFNKVADLKSISAAAGELNYLQSNMSNKIKNMEKYFHTQLFYRHSHGVELTSNGEKLYRQFSKIILLWEETEGVLRNEEENISIGIMRSSFPMQLNDVVKEFHQIFPNKKLSLISGSTDELISKTLKGELSIAYITELKDDTSAHNQLLRYKVLSTDKLVFTGKMKGKSLYRFLTEEHFYVFSRQCCSYKALSALMSSLGVHNDFITEINIVETFLDICQNGLGIGIIPESLALKYHFHEYEYLPEGCAELQRSLVYYGEHTISSAEKWFIEKSKSTLWDK